MCHSTGLPMEDEPEAAEKVLGALSLAMDAQDANMAAAKGVSYGLFCMNCISIGVVGWTTGITVHQYGA